MKIDNRIWVLITVVISGAVLAGAWFLGASPLLASSAEAAQSLISVTAQNQQTSSEIASLKASKDKLPELTSELSTLRQSVPTGVGGTAFISEVDSIAAASGVSVDSITLDPPVAYASPAVATATPAATGTSPSPSASPSASATPATSAPPVAAGPTAPAVVTDPLITASNFVVVAVHLEVKGNAAQTDAFLHGLQYGKRLILVTELTRTTDKDGVTLGVGGSIYVLRDTAAAAGGSANG